jgi:hypothetical protein
LRSKNGRFRQDSPPLDAKKLLFAGTLTAGGPKIELADGRLRIASEGRPQKFIDKVEQTTFSGSYAAETGQPVFYVIERCVFRRTSAVMELIEVAPGIDVERDILRQMSFKPIVDKPRPMNPLIFKPEPMGLEQLLLGLSLAERISYDQAPTPYSSTSKAFRPHRRRCRFGPARDGKPVQGDRPESSACSQL